MIDTTTLYYKYSKPLKKVELLEEGEIYYNESGHALRFKGADTYEFISGSPLREGYNISELTSTQLDLFWKLVKNKSLSIINFR